MKKVVLIFFYILCFSTNIFAQEPKYTSSDEPDVTHMDTPELRAYAAKKAQEIDDYCTQKCINDKDQETTAGMAKNAYAMNECMFDAIKAEIIKGFNEEQQQEMLEAVKQLRNYTNQFSYTYFNENKYCYGHCGTMAFLFPIADEGIMMRDLLAKLLFLNWHKGGY